MRCFEMKKNEGVLNRGRIFMVIEGYPSQVERVSKFMGDNHFKSTQCSDLNPDGTMADFYVISRSEKSDFMLTYKEARNQ